MNSAKISQLFEVMRAACVRQFGFNPRRIAADVRYVGTETHGKDLIHIFRTAGSHSQIALKGTYVSLREQQGEKPHWTESEKIHFKHTDAEIDAEIAARQAELEYTGNCSLYQDYREHLLSHYKEWPGYVARTVHPREAAKALVETLAGAGDIRLAEATRHLGTADPEHLAHLLLAACHLEIEATKGPPDLATHE